MTLKEILTQTKETFENVKKDNDNVKYELSELRLATRTKRIFDNLMKINCKTLDKEDLVNLLCEALCYMRSTDKIDFFEWIFDLYDIE